MHNDKNEDSSDDPIEELKSILDDVEHAGEEISEEGREITGKGQYFVDIARATKRVVPYLPPGEIENLISDWKPLVHQSGRILHGLQTLTNDVASDTDTFAGTATLSSTGSVSIFNPYVSKDYAINDPKAKAAVDNLLAVSGRFADANQVQKLLLSYRLDTAPRG